ncbi:MAG: tRNA (adenosine(37)-N6)-threonylcarbamoyltransferase complex ATPase subunit type 1 TsaE [Candidatus Cloacimonetes bacterium]|nr:tRNA (adenosine(37)-N6)-threonylcarbamoyltransferase complex ATPase subunit type 1 TsaE [Candidatus Cloacimonadota bacterium]
MMSPRLLRSLTDTMRLAEEIAEELKPGTVLALHGELGSGKTYFTKALCQVLGVSEYVSSPSFVLINEYRGRYDISHVDLYRLERMEEALELGFIENVPDRITIIEWPEIVEDMLPQDTIHVYFSFSNSYRRVLIKKGSS